MNFKTTIIAFFFLVMTGEILAQKAEPTAYKKLKTRKFYPICLNSYSKGDSTIYLVNDKRVSKYSYRREMRKFDRYDAVDKCKPCILKYYDENGILDREGVNYSDCCVGWFKDYYPNGKVKLSGWCKENPTRNWDSFSCGIPDRQWTYFKENGDTLYCEFWKEGEFITQFPEQKKMEIWKVTLTLNGKDATKLELSSSQLKEVLFTPKFKNSNRDSVNLSLELGVLGGFLRSQTYKFSLDSIKLFDIDEALQKKGYLKGDKLKYWMRILNNGQGIANYYLNILADLPEETDSITRSQVMRPKRKTKPQIENPKTYDFFLVNSLDSLKKVKLVHNVAYNLNYSENTFDTLIENKNISLSGYLESLGKTKLVFDVLTENITMNFNNGISSTTTNDYWKYKYEKQDYLRTVNLNAITSIDYTSPSRDHWGSFGSTTTFLSLLATVLVAPLVSINYKTGDFNQHRYYTIAGSGLVGLSVGIPLLVFGTHSKQYKLTQKNLNKSKELWYLESKIK
mgnify:CR=1 FL=1